MLGYLLEILMKAGALDVFYTSIQMKKNRPAYKLTVLCSKDKESTIEELIFKNTTTIGIRIREEERTVLPRELTSVNTIYGELQVKKVYLKDEVRLYPEYESAKKIAEENHLSIKQVYALLESEN